MFSENIGIGPVIGIDRDTDLKELKNDLLGAALVPVAVVQDKGEDVFKFFMKQYPHMIHIEAVLVTIEYYENFE